MFSSVVKPTNPMGLVDGPASVSTPKRPIAADRATVVASVDADTHRFWQRRSMSPFRTISIVVALSILVLTGCRSAPEEDAVLTIRQTSENLIRADVSTKAGLGDLTPVCPDVSDVAVGTAFDCTATTGDQRIISISAVINEEGRVALATNNMITAAALPSFERAAVDALNATVGSQLVQDAIDCGDVPVVFGQDKVMVCALLDPHTEKIFDVSLTITDIEARQFSLVVADQPRA